MQPLVQLLHRIQWDAEFGKGDFALGYYDRVARTELVVQLSAITVDADGGRIVIRDGHGVGARIPLHRVRTVYKDGEVIWRRPAQPTGRGA